MNNSLKLTQILLGIRVKQLQGMREFVQYVIIINQNWNMYMYVSLVLNKSTTSILYELPHIFE